MKPVVWHLKDIVYILKERQKNQFDGNVVVSGDRGNGKSTLLYKLFLHFNKFNPKKHQVYGRDDVIHLLKDQKFGICFDDEAVNSGYKRDFHSKAQQELIKIITTYRDNYNIYGSAIPNFFSLDKDLRDLTFLHLFVVERGIAVVHFPLQSLMYSQDRWDAKNNAKIESGWSWKIKSNPRFQVPFHKLSTFKGYLFFGDLTQQQRELYLQIKREKREEATNKLLDEALPENEKRGSFEKRVINLLVAGKMTEEGLLQACMMEDKKMSNVKRRLNEMLKDIGEKRSLSELLNLQKTQVEEQKKEAIKSFIPNFSIS
jgi:hypothetical protein